MKDIKDLTYEEGIKLLNEIIGSLEEDDLELEESVKKFQKGIGIYDHLTEILEKTEGEIKILIDEEKDLEKDF